MILVFLSLILLLSIFYIYLDQPIPSSPSYASSLKVAVVEDPQDVLRNPYVPPTRTPYPEDYKQIGYIQKHRRAPLFGKPVNVRRDTWYYYTLLDGIKLPFYVNKRKSTEYPGISSLSSGDMVMIDHEAWRVELYDIPW
jgi:hypothetical protein